MYYKVQVKEYGTRKKYINGDVHSVPRFWTEQTHESQLCPVVSSRRDGHLHRQLLDPPSTSIGFDQDQHLSDGNFE